MRIQHNIMAMNAYRNYTNNVNAMKSNLEKLSSGYKINRAGDDAAGLAISEKMRAQITGLETAQKNAKDGISLVQTAEGALTEVHDMLNRMVELATMSANGTYDNTTDRAQLQKEMDQLNSEINRIADSANFNGIKLLDGSMDADGRIANTETIFSGVNVANNVFGKAPSSNGFGGPNKATNKKLELTGGYLNKTVADRDGVGAATDGAGKVNKSDDGVRYHQEAKGAGKTEFTVDLDGIDFKADTGTTIKNLVFGLQSGVTASDVTATKAKNNVLYIHKTGVADADKLRYDVTAKDGEISSKDIANGIMKAINDAGGKVYIEPAGGGNRIEYEVIQNGDKLTFKMTNDGFDKAVELTNKYNTDAGTTKATDAVNYFQGNFNINVHYQTLNTGTAATTAGTNEYLQNKFINAIDDKLLGNCSTCEINEGSVSTGTIYAQAYIRFTGDSNAPTAISASKDGFNKVADIFKNGSGLKIGDDYYVFAASDEVYNTQYADNVHVVDIRDLGTLNKAVAGKATEATALKDGLKKMNDVVDGGVTGNAPYKDALVAKQTEVDAVNDFRKALDRLSVAAKDNAMFDVQVENRGTALVLNERTTYSGSANLTESNFGLESQIGTFDSASSTTTVTKEAGKALTLQIGDTAEDFNQLKVNIKDIHTSALGLDKIRIDDQTSAAAAVDVIKNAINMVSDIRGTLGATQNRLDHTINNLSVMTENIQDAESTIRDTDVAAEMMKYTKNNILIQSAQAMLAQANQVPQGVLQLLQ